jgi:hypothetical protein
MIEETSQSPKKRLKKRLENECAHENADNRNDGAPVRQVECQSRIRL